MSSDGFQSALVQLFRETFEGKIKGKDSTWFVDGNNGILQTINGLTAEEASRKPKEGMSSVAAHTFHMRFALHWDEEDDEEGDWESTWLQQEVTEEDWTILKQELEYRYERFLSWIESNNDWSFENAHVSVLAQLPHLAYHLGAIQQLSRLVQN